MQAPMVREMKRMIRRLLAGFGYDIRAVDHRSDVRGVNLVHDARTMIGGKSQVVLFDVGANVGQTVEDLLDAFRNPRIFSFEPSPTTFDMLRRTYAGKPGICLENIALGEREGIMPFHVTQRYSSSDSLLRPTWDARAKEVQVRVETLDGYCERHGIGVIDLLKMIRRGMT